MRLHAIVCLGAALGFAALAQAAGPRFRDFVRVQGDQLVEAGRPYRFVSFNIPNLHLVEDKMEFSQVSSWRWPDRFEIADALESVRQAGGTAVRTYVISVLRTNDPAATPRHVLAPGRFNEQGFRALDEVLAVANRTGVRVIIPLVDNWSWWGGIAEYAGFRGLRREAFWSDPGVIEDFKATIRHVLNRTNTVTGVAYREDRAILAWETGNELQSPPEWTRQIAAYLKSLDARHPVIDGFHSTVLREESLAMPEVDIVTTHHYPGGPKPYHELVRENWARAAGRKPYFVGEFGFVPISQVAEFLAAVRETGTAGALLWSLRFRDRDGGFYWHSEPAGGDVYKAYHWPGFPSGADYEELNLMRLMQREAFAIRGEPIPALVRPAAPRLLPAKEPGLCWQGSVGAVDYTVERARTPRGPWRVVGKGIDETRVQGHPLFCDPTTDTGVFFYRVIARNAAGTSPPSDVSGAVQKPSAWLVDELEDPSLLHDRQGETEFKKRSARRTKEDAHRLAVKPGGVLVYRLPAAIRSVRLFAFSPTQDGGGLRFAFSRSGQDYQDAPAAKAAFHGGAGDYGYWTPVFYQCRDPRYGMRFVRIEAVADAEIGRVEIAYGE